MAVQECQDEAGNESRLPRLIRSIDDVYAFTEVIELNRISKAAQPGYGK